MKWVESELSDSLVNALFFAREMKVSGNSRSQRVIVPYMTKTCTGKVS